MSYQTDITQLILSNLAFTFPNSSNRLRIWAETDKYYWKEDESVYNQKKGTTAPQFEAHFDGEFISFIDGNLSQSENLVIFLENLKKLFVERKIFIHEEMYKVEAAKKEEARAKEPDVVIPKARNEVEGMVVDVLTKHAKKRGRKVKIK